MFHSCITIVTAVDSAEYKGIAGTSARRSLKEMMCWDGAFIKPSCSLLAIVSDNNFNVAIQKLSLLHDFSLMFTFMKQ